MPPKKGGKKGKAAKAPAYASKAADCEPFGFLARDLIRTPLGLDAVVLGVKYADPKRPGENGVMWVQYAATKLEAPIEDPRTTAGYSKLSEGTHVLREANRCAREIRLAREKKEVAEAAKRAKEEAARRELEALEAKKNKKKPKPKPPPAEEAAA